MMVSTFELREDDTWHHTVKVFREEDVPFEEDGSLSQWYESYVISGMRLHRRLNGAGTLYIFGPR